MTEGDGGFLVDEDDIAEPWRRIVGFVVDWMILVMVALVIISALGIDLGDRDALRLPTSARLVQGLVGAAYYIGFTVSRGQTPGKMLIGTRVVMERTSRIPGLGPSALRWAVPGVFVFLPGVSIISAVIYGWLLFDTLRRGLHDKAAKTVVVRAR
ncbi:MAG: RDD family protein [Acidimicrobiia bacterium]